MGSYSPEIVCVRKDLQRQGLGTKLFKASLARAHADDVTVLSGECSPRGSLAFWMKHGFRPCDGEPELGPIAVRRVLQKKFVISARFPRVKAAITFFPEAALYEANVVRKARNVQGARLHDGSIKLQRRVIGCRHDEPQGRDLVIRIEVDGAEVCFCKAKHEAAVNAGVVEDRVGGAFYIDVIQLTNGG